MQFGIFFVQNHFTLKVLSLMTNTEEINQAIEILTKLSLYCKNGKDIRAAVQICSTLVFRV